MNKIVLIGDIVASKKIAQRKALQERLASALAALNEHNPNLASRYTITLGDEFQAVFHTAESLFYETIQILSAAFPEKIRFSFGVGTILTEINYEQALGMDGPAFYQARDGVNELKESDCLYRICGLAYPHLELLNQSLCLFSHTCRNWNLNRFQILARLQQGSAVQEIAQELNISDKAVYKNIAMGNLETVQALFKEIAAIINEGLG